VNRPCSSQRVKSNHFTLPRTGLRDTTAGREIKLSFGEAKPRPTFHSQSSLTGELKLTFRQGRCPVLHFESRTGLRDTTPGGEIKLSFGEAKPRPTFHSQSSLTGELKLTFRQGRCPVLHFESRTGLRDTPAGYAQSAPLVS
jgi:hypothetical protein